MNDEEATNNCESAVDIEAAIIAESIRPAINPGKICPTTLIKIKFLPFGRSSADKAFPPKMNVLPKKAIKIAAPSVKTTQIYLE